jgi:farnesyl-diphosphate farnesyltransferase
MSLETPSGKSAAGENFPVGSFLIQAELRPHVHAFYRFARTGDDIADNPVLAADEKVRRLERMAEVLQGASDPKAPAAAAMRASLAASGVTPDHCLELLEAFKLDATKGRYDDWADLLGYCRLSAMPVGRHVLDLHGEARATWAWSDPLCAALQVLNHLQDCAEDFRLLDRVYLPLDLLAAHGATVDDLTRPSLTPGLRRVVDQLLDDTEALNRQGRGLLWSLRDRRLRCETAVIVSIAERLARRLRARDPLAERVKLKLPDMLLAFATGVSAGLGWWAAA